MANKSRYCKKSAHRGAEYAEEKEVIDNVMATFYPEFGLMIHLDPLSRVMFAARYNYSSEGRDHDFWIYTLGFSYSY